MIEAQVWQRVLHFAGERGRPGAGVVLDVGENQYLVTAKHLASEDSEEQVTLQHLLTNGGRPFSVVLERVGDRTGAADIAAYRLERRLVGAALPLTLGSAGMTYSDDVYILGYPFGLTFETGGEDPQHMPLAKKGIVSGSGLRSGIRVHYLDIFANPGFSGGPAVVKVNPSRRLAVVGIVQGQLTGPAVETDPAAPNQAHLPAGITVIVDAGHVTELLAGG